MPDLRIISIPGGTLVQTRPEIDLIFDGVGRILDGPILVSGDEAAAQDAVRGLLTIVGTNPSAPNFGTLISRLLNARQVSAIAQSLSNEVQSVMGYLSQVSANFDLTEQIVQIDNLSVKQGERQLNMDLSLLTGSGQAVRLGVNL